MLGKNVSEKITGILSKACKKYFQENLSDVSFPEHTEVALQVTRDSRHGDMSSNIVMRLAAAVRSSPAVLGEGIIAIFRDLLKKTGLSVFLGDIELKGGFINFRFSDEYYRQLLINIHDQKSHFGRSDEGRHRHVNLEFVSANPTGPLTIAHGRQAAIGDTLSRILRFNGYHVTNEYYLNDVGRQISLLGESVEVRYRNLFGRNDPMPEQGYMGSYIKDIAEEIRSRKGGSLLADSPHAGTGSAACRFFQDHAVGYIMRLIKRDLADFGVVFDTWTSQGGIEKREEVKKVLELLEKDGYVYEHEGARWFASTRFGDDKDRVVMKSDGSYTYLAPDIAYHHDKYQRGYSRLIDLLGPDHHGYIKRMKSAVQALGHEAGSLDILIVQLVTLLRGGQAVSMSTRRGEFISLREVIDEIGKDVTRFFFLSRRLDSHLDFDIELAKKESADNPVFYIQYAHARICSIKKYSRGHRIRLFFRRIQLELLTAKEEKQLMRKLSEFPFAVKSGADTLEPNRLIAYLNELARSFHSFYTECRVISDDAALSKARLFLVECVRIVLANGLGLLNITLPEKM
ncbi:MAG: arginine--tRNA ligase [Candidatus Makaraimicrobium thalassicum]|nr:MAG: arginine--tRNA ligase [Candidatus Omnitrophota bacterium]